jgi:hypothetical protein
MKPPAVFRFTTGRARLRHTWPAQVGDLDADDVVRCLDRDCDRLAGCARAAVPDAVGEKLAHEQGGHVPARVPRAEYPVHERAGDPHPLRPPARVMVSRTAPVISATALPCPHRPREVSGPSGAHRDARSTRRRASSLDTPPARPVRSGPWKRRRCAPTVVTAHTDRRSCPDRPAQSHGRPSAIRPWTAQHNGLQRDRMTHLGTKENASPAREFAASGAFSQVVAGVGFEPT